MKRIGTFLLVVVPCVLCSCTLSNSDDTVGLEKPKYTILEQKGNIQIRRYQPMIVAETLVDSDFENAGNVAFSRLFNYISGNNRMKTSIAMTAPVNQQAASEKIAMTAPVTQQQSQGKYAICFVMPSKYTLETLPQPLDGNIIIKQIPPCKYAAIRYSGTWTKKRYDTYKSQLDKFIQQQNLKVAGPPVWARYNSPFQLFFFRRNEILIPIE